MALLGLSAHAYGDDATGAKGGVVQFEIGNEDRGVFAPVFEPLFDNTMGENTSDGHLSWSWRLAYTPHRTNPKWFRPIHDNIPWLSEQATVRTSSSLQQYAFMPDETRQNAGLKERPHAGFLAYEERISLADPMSEHTQRVDTLAMTVGIVGPLSGGEKMHKLSHNLTGLSSASWNQLDNEPVLNVSYDHARRFLLLKSQAQENLEFMPYAGAAVGNALTYGAVGATLRLGAHLTQDNGSQRPGPLLNSNTFARKGDYLAWNVFLGTEGRVVARNLFLDGNTFGDDGLSVDKKTFVYDVQAGFEIGWGASRFTVVNLWRDKEFKTQSDPDQLLKASFSYSF